MANTSGKEWVNSLRSFDRKLARAIYLVCTVFLAAIMAIIFFAVICRFVIHYSTPWTEEFTRFSFIAMSFLGMGACLTMNEHIEIDVFSAIAHKIKNLDKRYIFYKIDDIFRYLFIGGLGSYLMYLYIDYTMKQYKMNQISAGLHLPMWILYVVLTVGFALLIIHCIINIIVIIGNYEAVRGNASIKGEFES